MSAARSQNDDDSPVDADVSLLSIWDSDYIETLDGNTRKCGHCKNGFRGHNDTKTRGKDIAPCKGQVSESMLIMYRSLHDLRVAVIEKKRISM